MARVNLTDIPSLPSQSAPASNISNLRAIVDNDFKGATVSFNVVATTNTVGIVLLRSMTNSVLAAVELESVPLAIGAYSYDDRAAAIVGKQVWYWIRLENSDGYFTYIGDITVSVKKGAAPQAVNWLEVSGNLGGTEEVDAVRVNVVCEVVAGADVSGGIAVFVTGYQGNPDPILIYQDTTQTLSFHLKQTGEMVSFQVASVNAAGELSAMSAAVNFTLNGFVTKPCRLTGLSALEGNGVTQISFMAGLETDISLYRLYRGPYGGSFLGAAVVATLEPTDESDYSIQDDVINGNSHTYQWYVTAVGNGESDASDAVYPAVAWA